jgi:hypothetical protein
MDKVQNPVTPGLKNSLKIRSISKRNGRIAVKGTAEQSYIRFINFLKDARLLNPTSRIL